MPKRDNTPIALRPYEFHGLDLEWGERNAEATSTCPFCHSESKFSINIESSKFKCFKCAESGNATSFLSKIYRECEIQEGSAKSLLKERGLRYLSTIEAWGLKWSHLQNEWIVPGFSTPKKLHQLYRYVRIKNKKTGKWSRVLLPTPSTQERKREQGESSHGIFGLNLWDDKKQVVYITEGVWDGMVLYESLRFLRVDENGKLISTSNVKKSLYNEVNIISIAGVHGLSSKLARLLAGKDVTILFDNDYPKTVKVGSREKVLEPAGYRGAREVTETLVSCGEPPERISYLNWGEGGYTKDLPDGTDLRDVLTSDIASSSLSGRARALTSVLERIEPVKDDWISTAKNSKTKPGTVEIELLPCQKWVALINAWRKPMKWTDGLNRALAAMLASVVSTKTLGDQLWLKIIGPASCGKSTLCEAISTNKKYIVAKSTIRGFHSGFKTDGAGEEDNSLIAQLYDKTLITKDGDTLLQSPNLGQILAEARDIYDCTSRTHYRNKTSRSYEGVRMTWLLCGTSSLRSIDTSELGERFLDCVIMDGIDSDLEEDILWRVANRADRSTNYEANGKPESNQDPEMSKAMQLTGGYVSYLRENAKDLLEKVVTGKQSLRKIMKFGKFVAYLRARPSMRQEENAEREFAARLVSQHVKLAKCLAVVLNKETLDKEVLAMVRAISIDTARGRTLDILREMRKERAKGLPVKSISIRINEAENSVRKLLRFMQKIGIVERVEETTHRTRGVRAVTHWRMTEEMYDLYLFVIESKLRRKRANTSS